MTTQDLQEAAGAILALSPLMVPGTILLAKQALEKTKTYQQLKTYIRRHRQLKHKRAERKQRSIA